MIGNYIKKILGIFLLFMPLVSNAQTDRDYIRKGNTSYRQKNYTSAETMYRKALNVNPENPQALYNLGCALMMQDKSSEAVKFYQKASGSEKNKLRKAKIYHNIGVICQASKMYDEAIKAYCESLRNNPKDNETRYNLALCKKLRKNSGKQDKNKDNNKNDKKQNQEKDKNNDKNTKDKDNNKQAKQDEAQPKMSKDNAEQLLNAAMQHEEETQEKLSKNRRMYQEKRFEKNW